MSDTAKATLFLIGFALILPAMYLAPTVLNAITDVAMRVGG